MKAAQFAVSALLSMGLLFQLQAHPPSAIDFAWDAGSQILTLTMMHPTPDTEKHWIDKVLIAVDGSPVCSQELTYQTEPEHQRTVILLTRVKPGAVLEVTAECNVFGKKKVNWTIPEGN